MPPEGIFVGIYAVENFQDYMFLALLSCKLYGHHCLGYHQVSCTYFSNN